MRDRGSRPLNRSGAPDGAPIIVGTHANPVRLAWTLARRRRVRRLLADRGRAACSIAAVVLPGALIAVAGWRQLSLHGAILLSPLLAHPFVTASMVAALGWVATMRRRRHVECQFVQSWLASAPVLAHDRRAALRRRVGVEALTPIAAVPAALACAGLASGVPVADLLAALVAGLALGAIAGWRSGAKPSRRRAAASPRLRRPRAATSRAASLAPLGRWPFAQLRAAASPRIEARLICALLLGLPTGIPPSLALLIVAFAANALAAFSLLRASLATLAEAAGWLRATPVGLGAFARAACLRAGACQAAFATLGGMLAHALGASASTAALLAAAWLGACATATAGALACRHRPARLMIELAGTGALLLAIADVAPLALALALPALWLWQAIRMRKA